MNITDYKKYYFFLFLFVVCFCTIKLRTHQSNGRWAAAGSLMGKKSQSNYSNTKSPVFLIQEYVKKHPCTNTNEVYKAMTVCEYNSKIHNKLGIFDEEVGFYLGMSKDYLHLARLYINTVKLSITNAFYIYFNGLIDGHAWPPGGSGQAITMTGIRRIDNLQFVLEDAISRGLDGDFIELGVWKGGLCILATAVFNAYKQYNRKGN